VLGIGPASFDFLVFYISREMYSEGVENYVLMRLFGPERIEATEM
jgi:hypothetical protein